MLPYFLQEVMSKFRLFLDFVALDFIDFNDLKLISDNKGSNLATSIQKDAKKVRKFPK